MITIYGFPMSPFTTRVILACRAGKLPYELKTPPGGLKSADFLLMSPLGKVPVIVDDGSVLSESTVILDYLDDKYRITGPEVSPAIDIANERLRMVMSDIYLQTPVSALFRLWVFGDKDRAKAVPHVEDITKILDLFESNPEKYLQPKRALLGRAEFCNVPALAFLTRLYARFDLPNPLDTRAVITGYWKKLSSHAAVHEHLEVMYGLLDKRLGS